MKKSLSPEQALNKLRNLCSKQEKAEGDLRKKLLQWQIGSSDADDIIKTLKEEKFLDHQRYARAFVHDKYNFSGWGTIKIQHALKQKGIENVYIEEALEENIKDKDEYNNKLYTLLEQKIAGIKNEPDVMKKKAKLFRYGQSRGYEPWLIYEILDRLVGED
jgi:regulatory protein